MNVAIKIKEGTITNDPFCKPPDYHWYLYCDSCHAQHLKKINCLLSNTSTEKNMPWKSYLDSDVKNLKEWFGKRSYSEHLIKEQVARALQFTSNNSDNNCKQVKERGAPLVTTYHPRHKDLISFIKNTFIETKMIRKCLQLCHLLLSGVPENLRVTW